MSKQLKRRAAERAADFLAGVRVLGLGTGSTAAEFIAVVAERLAAGELTDLVAVPTSIQTEQQARALGIPLTDLDAHPQLDVTVDGADEVDRDLNLIKGMGGALTREKIVAAASRELIVVVDESKLVGELGTTSPLPVEVLYFGWKATASRLGELGAETARRQVDGEPFETDEGNLVFDCRFPRGILQPQALSAAIDAIPGVVAHGLFLGMADRVIVAGERGIGILERA